MKKLIPALLFAALFMTFAACGDDKKDEPVFPTTQQLESEHGQTNDTYLIWDIDMMQDSSSIYVYNAVFSMGETTSKPLNIRVDAPCSRYKSREIYTFIGTGINDRLVPKDENDRSVPYTHWWPKNNSTE